MLNLQLNDDFARLLWEIRCKIALVQPDLAGAVKLIDEALDAGLKDWLAQAKQAATDASIRAYYDNMSEEARQEELAWARCAAFPE